MYFALMVETIHPKLAMERLVRRISVLQDRSLAAAGLELTAKQATLLILLHSNQRALAVHQLSAELMVNQSATTRLVDRLEKRGLVVRRRDGEDRRVVAVSLTRSGSDAAISARRVVESLKADLVKEIPPHDLETFWRVLGWMELAASSSVDPASIDPR